MIDLIFASGNSHKLKEIQSILPDGLRLSRLADWGIHDDLPETGSSLEENAIQKAAAVFAHTSVNCFAEDTGLEVFALDMEPGVYSARYAGEERNAESNMELLLHRLKPGMDRKARFRTVIALFWNQSLLTFEGTVDGAIAFQKTGSEGFGYDPIFIPDGYSESFGVLGMEVKKKISHRSRAFQKMIDYIHSQMDQIK